MTLFPTKTVDILMLAVNKTGLYLQMLRENASVLRLCKFLPVANNMMKMSWNVNNASQHITSLIPI